MKLLSLATLATVATSAVAQPHKPHHRHPHPIAKRGPNGAIYEPGPVETVIVYVLNGQPISQEEVNQGINNGTLIWGDDDNLTSVAALPTQTPAPPPVQPPPEQPAPPKSTGAPAPAPEPESNSHPEPQKQPEPAPQPQPQPQPQPEQNQYGPSNPSNSYDGIDKEFPSGTFGCDSFPKGYGATPVDHAGLGGWIGIQDPGVANAAGFDDIMTVPHGSCSDGTCCKPGAFCSYSCPPGYLKSSWPEKQGITKQSIGGLYCNPSNSKLELASGAIAKTLCVKGTDQVTIKVRNKLSVAESICRTDYPGTESETVPITTSPNQELELACPDNSHYYKWDGKPTSAQYYINPKGTPEKDACQWGNGGNTGNWAPVNLGVGYNSGDKKGYISLFPNAPTNPNGKLDFNVELVADDMNGRCKYEGGKYYSGENYGDVSATTGCTIALNSGTLYVVLTE